MDNSSGTSLPSGINTTRYFLSVMFNSSERELILASGSCRRRKLLDKLNISYRRARHRLPLEEVAQDHRILAQLERLDELRKATQDGSTESNSDDG